MSSHGAASQFDPQAVPEWVPGWLHWLYDIGRFIVDHVFRVLTRNVTLDDLLAWFLFILLLVGFYWMGRGARSLLRRTLLAPHRVDPGFGRLMGHSILFVFLLLGFSFGLGVFGTDLAAVATGLGLLSLALGFGMQNTVANIMGGISLSVDRPFRIGDRIQVGTYWGTVTQIGLRSTRIETPRKENVIIPNKIMEEREIWNYTLGTPEYRLDIDAGISFDSDWRLAEKIMIEAADAHPNILHFPPPRVVMRPFADSHIPLQLRTWIADVTTRADTISDILKSVKDRFDREGVEIPFPYRTIVYKKDLDHPKAAKPGEVKPFLRKLDGMRILVAVAGPQPVRERADFVASLAKALAAGVVALYIDRPGAGRAEGEEALRILGEVMRTQRIWYKPVVRGGDIITTIRDIAREEDVDLILVGAGRGGVSTLWKRRPEVGSRLRTELRRPVFTVPRDLKLTPQLVSWLQDQMKTAKEVRREIEAGGTPPPEEPHEHHEEPEPASQPPPKAADAQPEDTSETHKP